MIEDVPDKRVALILHSTPQQRVRDDFTTHHLFGGDILAFFKDGTYRKFRSKEAADRGNYDEVDVTEIVQKLDVAFSFGDELTVNHFLAGGQGKSYEISPVSYSVEIGKQRFEIFAGYDDAVISEAAAAYQRQKIIRN